jgi:glycosyltransferase involved in cell wall biosynthesis
VAVVAGTGSIGVARTLAVRGYSRRPVASERDVVVLAGTDWKPLWQQQQELASRFARAGGRVVYVENVGVREPRARDIGRVLRRLRRGLARGTSAGVSEVAPRLHVLSPLVLPPLGSRARRWLNRRFLLPRVRRAIEGLGLRDPVVITFLPTDTAVDLAELLTTPGGQTVYCCTADFAELARRPDRLRASERALLGRSDLVLASCIELVDHCAPWAPRVHLFPPGVDTAVFAPPPQTRTATAAPVIGYVGGLHRHVDVALLAELARMQPGWRIVCVGPIQRPCPELRRLPNVSLLGPRDHADIAEHIAGFDVCLVPYVRSAYTDTVSPTKLLEYLAMGKPVVATALPAVADLTRRFGDVVTIAPNDPVAFVAAVQAALPGAGDVVAAARRRHATRGRDWEQHMATLRDLIELEPAA